jgi:hypothetical protein
MGQSDVKYSFFYFQITIVASEKSILLTLTTSINSDVINYSMKKIEDGRWVINSSPS